MKRLGLPRLRVSFFSVCLATLGWAAGCATPGPLIDPYFAARSYTPARIALMPTDVFVVYDEVGDNDARRSQALGQEVGAHIGRVLGDDLQRKGYQVSLAGWDGIRAQNGSYLMSGEELGWLANSILQFSGSPAGGGSGLMPAPAFVAPELANKVGAAGQVDSLMYVNVKGVAVSPGKKAAQVVGVVFFVVILVAIVLLIVAEGKGGGRSGNPGSVLSRGSAAPRSVRAASGWRGPAAGVAQTATVARIAAPTPRGYGAVPAGRGPVYAGPSFGLGIGVVVPLEGPAHTHEGAVVEDDEDFAGDQAYVSATIVSTYDGRVLWHARQSIDVALDRPREVQRMIDRLVATIPPSLSQGAAPAAAKH